MPAGETLVLRPPLAGQDGLEEGEQPALTGTDLLFDRLQLGDNSTRNARDQRLPGGKPLRPRRMRSINRLKVRCAGLTGPAPAGMAIRAAVRGAVAVEQILLEARARSHRCFAPACVLP